MKNSIYSLLLVVFFTSTIGNIYAQDYYSKVFFKQGSSVLATSITDTYDGSYIIAGDHDGKNLLLKIDENAVMEWNLELGINYDLTGQIIELQDSTYLLATDHYIDGLNYSVLTCICLNELGEILWTTTTSFGNSVDVFSVEQTQDNGTIIGANLNNPSSPPYNSCVVVKLDETGVLQWAREINEGSHRTNIGSIKQLSDSGFIIAGTVSDLNPYSSRSYLMKLDNSGNVSWTKLYRTNEFDNSEGYEVYAEDDGYIFLMNSDWRTHIVKTNPDGEVNWAKKYNTWGEPGMYTESRRRILKTSDTSYVVFVPDILFSINDVGELNWATYYFTYLQDVAESSDGGFLVVGNGPVLGVSKIPWDPQIGVIKTDATGHTDELCSHIEGISYDTVTVIDSSVIYLSEPIGEIVSFEIEVSTDIINVEENSCVAFIGSTEENSKINSFEIFPNPTSGLTKINSIIPNFDANLRVMDINGRELINMKITSENSVVDVRQFGNGIYYLQISNGNTQETHKLVVTN